MSDAPNFGLIADALRQLADLQTADGKILVDLMESGLFLPGSLRAWADALDAWEPAAVTVCRSDDDTARLDWLGAQEGVNLLSDDGGRWAVSGDGFQPVPDADGFKGPVVIQSLVEPEGWRASIREAIDSLRIDT